MKTKPIQFDPELLSEEFNETRRPNLPYGIIKNANPAGIFIPEDQLSKANWLPIPEQLTTIELSQEISGLLLTKCRLLLLGCTPEYLRYKDIKENGDLARTFIGTYEQFRERYDKKTMDVCSEHALIFLNAKKQPTHEVPIVVCFRNVALWSFKQAKDKFYTELEKVWAKYNQIKYSGKNDQWRSLGVLNVQFSAVKEGEGKKRHECCKTEISLPTLDNLPKLFLGTPEKKAEIWEIRGNIAGFLEGTTLPALPAANEPEPPEVEVLNGNGSKAKMRRIELVEDEDFDEELDDLEAFDDDLEEED